jgi:hypothetical protein
MTKKCEMDDFQHHNPTQLMEFLQTKFIFMIYNIILTYLPAKVCEKAKKPTEKVETDGSFPNRQDAIKVKYI